MTDSESERRLQETKTGPPVIRPGSRGGKGTAMDLDHVDSPRRSVGAAAEWPENGLDCAMHWQGVRRKLILSGGIRCVGRG